MNREFIRKRNHSQEAPTQLRHGSPETYPIVLLRFDANGRFDDSNAHVAREIRPLPEDPTLEIWSERVIGHTSMIAKASLGQTVGKA